jgi:hypothetical protein
MFILTGIPPRGRSFHGNWHPSFGEGWAFLYCLCLTSMSFQAATAVGTNQDILIDLFERIEDFFRRLEVYTEVQPTTEMVEIVVKIMVEVLFILAIATKEVKQSKTSELTFREKPFLLAYQISETCLKKLVGRTDIEDALQKLDKLTADEVWMVAAQGLKAIQCVSNSMKVIEDKVTEGTCVH